MRRKSDKCPYCGKKIEIEYWSITDRAAKIELNKRIAEHINMKCEAFAKLIEMK